MSPGAPPHAGNRADVTEAVQVERALRQSGESYRLLAENVQEMIMRFTPQGQILYASPAARTILGYDPADVVGREGKEFLHPADLDRGRRCPPAAAPRHRAAGGPLPPASIVPVTTCGWKRRLAECGTQDR